MKKALIAAAAFPLIFGVCAYAAYTDDFTKSALKPCTVKDGTAYTYFSRVTSIFNIEQNDTEITAEINGNSITLKANSNTAYLNGNPVELKNKPYTNSDGTLYFPAREVIEMLGGHIAYFDPLSKYSPKPTLRAYFGEEIKPSNGTYGDSFSNWSITVPAGFYRYAVYLDTNEIIFDNFNGISIEVERWRASFPIKSESENLDDYLIRTEAITGADGALYYIKGKIYSNPTPENRAVLNTIIDSFVPEFTEGAQDVSNISADGKHWEYRSSKNGISVDVPFGYDTNNYNHLYTNVDYVMNIGFYYGEATNIKAYLYRDILPDEFIAKSNDVCAYLGIEPEKNYSEFNYGGFSGYISKDSKTDLYDDQSISCYIDLLIGSGNNTYQFIFSDKTSEYNGIALETAEQLLDEAMYNFLSTLKLSEPSIKGLEKPLPDISGNMQLVDINGIKFNVPEHLLYSSEEEGTIVGSDYPETEELLGLVNLKQNANMIPDADDGLPHEQIEINGILFDKYTDQFFDGAENEQMLLYVNTAYDIAMLYVSTSAKQSQYTEDLQAVINSVHI